MSTNMLHSYIIIIEGTIFTWFDILFALIRLFPEIFAVLSYTNKSIVPSISKIQLDWPSLRHQAKSSFLRSEFMSLCKVEKILKGSLDLIPSPSVKIMGGKVCLRCKGKTLLGVIKKHLNTKSLLTSPSNVLPYSLK